MTNYDKALEYLKTASLRGSKLGLERIVRLLALMEDPQDQIKAVHISGTNGKGSFGAMLGSVLKTAGYITGSFSSPAITEVTDSFRINGSEISREDFGDLICSLAPLCESMDDKPTEFEVLTAAAYKLFAEKNCDIALVECGMGGDLDSTNVLHAPLLSVITNVQKDHCSFLGNTTEEIARHKSGIIRPGCPVLFGGSDPKADKVIIDAAEKAGSELYRTDLSRISDVSCFVEGMEFSFEGFGRLRICLPGTYQLYNAANVLTAIEILRKRGLDITDSDVRAGLENAKWHGRFEVLSRDPLVIFDGSHNPDGIRYAADSIRLYSEKKIALLIGVMADKEYCLYADMLGNLTDKAFTVKPDNPRALDSSLLADSFTAKGIRTAAFTDLEEGVREAYEYARRHDIPLIALGSLYMYREFIRAFAKIAPV